jgi:N6-adenosine-specific RNA methylase IME4/ParB-like chromosome segregation protein Spo0J
MTAAAKKQRPEEIGGYRVHPAASELPMMSEEEIAQLAVDIKENGLREPIVVLDGVVLDGRNRLTACLRAGVKPEFTDWTERGYGIRDVSEEEAIVSYIASMNLARRHLSKDQKAAIALRLVPHAEVEAKARKQAGLKKGAVSAPGALTEGKGKAAASVAAAAGVGTRTLERARSVEKRSPELVEKVRRGEVTLKQAEKQIRKADQVAKVKAYVPPEGRYNVIVADPPWPYEDTLEGSDEARGGLPYPPMKVWDIATMKVPADDDCILWLWVTNAHLLDGSAGRVLDAWGFTPKTLLTWNKGRMGAGRWLRGQTEHCILAVRGSPKVELANQTTLLEAPRREHSRKPDEFFALVEKLCPGTARLELFAREARIGWVTSGAEAPEDVPVDDGSGPISSSTGGGSPGTWSASRIGGFGPRSTR